jgi:hypothetical protein
MDFYGQAYFGGKSDVSETSLMIAISLKHWTLLGINEDDRPGTRFNSFIPCEGINP